MDDDRQPVRYVGNEFANTDYYDGQLQPVVGVNSYQVMRANRSRPDLAEGVGWTYNHAPMLAYWNGRFYLEFLSNPIHEGVTPGHTLLTSSLDGIHWEKPVVIFPEQRVPDGVYRGPYPLPAGSWSDTHQRMGFYVAPNGRLLVLAFYGCAPTTGDLANNGFGIGRVAREIFPDGGLGPIYFVHYNRHAGWGEHNTFYPFYKTSDDAGFVAACEDLLADRLITLQWWEEDQSPDGFYAVEGYKALSYYHLLDGGVVGLWKFSKAAISHDEGRTWSPVADVPSLVMTGAKIWGQRTSDGRFALVYNPNCNPSGRWPLGLVTSENGIDFDHLSCVVGEVPPLRYPGAYKNRGPQYVRGIVEGNGTPPDGALWITHSMNKEDIWVTRIPVPVRRQESRPVDDTFDSMATGGVVTGWNVYSPRWASVSVIDFPGPEDKSLELRDCDPYDYARAERVFPESTRVTIEFKVMVRDDPRHGELQFEVVDRHGLPALRLTLGPDYGVWLGAGRQHAAGAYQLHQWMKVAISLDTVIHRWDLAIDGRPAVQAASMLTPIRSVERLLFRTGPRRTLAGVETDDQDPVELPHAGDPVQPACYCVNYVKTSEHSFVDS